MDKINELTLNMINPSLKHKFNNTIHSPLVNIEKNIYALRIENIFNILMKTVELTDINPPLPINIQNIFNEFICRTISFLKSQDKNDEIEASIQQEFDIAEADNIKFYNEYYENNKNTFINKWSSFIELARTNSFYKEILYQLLNHLD